MYIQLHHKIKCYCNKIRNCAILSAKSNYYFNFVVQRVCSVEFIGRLVRGGKCITVRAVSVQQETLSDVRTYPIVFILQIIKWGFRGNMWTINQISSIHTKKWKPSIMYKVVQETKLAATLLVADAKETYFERTNQVVLLVAVSWSMDQSLPFLYHTYGYYCVEISVVKEERQLYICLQSKIVNLKCSVTVNILE